MRCLSLLVWLFSYCVCAQPATLSNAAGIYQQIEKLNFLGTALYIAAHPDDENTRLISYLANDLHARTAYLSITRGDGGQNLIGAELREALGLIRTHELLAARKIDGGEQFFTRANDFGFSKNPEETLQIWQKDTVLADIVQIIRQLKPDVIINRFDHRTPGTTHGHHTASALLSVMAFDQAADKFAFPSQLKTLQPWQPTRLFFNTSWWFYGGREQFEKADKSALLGIDIGTYYPLLGFSNQEIAAKSRSCHQSQGFGSAATRGTDMEYLELLKGTIPKNGSIFDGINTSWKRVEGGEAIGKAIDNILRTFNFNDPAASLPLLAQVYQQINSLTNSHWRTIKSAEAAAIIAACAGLHMEVTTSVKQACPGAEVPIQVEIINRSTQPIKLEGVILTPGNNSMVENRNLEYNKAITEKATLRLPHNLPLSNPYYLNLPHTNGMYEVENRDLIGLPEAPKAIFALFNIAIHGIKITYRRDIMHKYTDDIKGELYEPFHLVPPVSIIPEHRVHIFTKNGKEKEIKVTLRAGKKEIKGQLKMQVPQNWTVAKNLLPFYLKSAQDETTLSFLVSAPDTIDKVIANFEVLIEQEQYSFESKNINYPHIPSLRLLQKADVIFVKPDLRIGREKIGYIMGAGDEIPQVLRQMGYEVTILQAKAINSTQLADYDVIMTGIRAYNTVPEFATKQELLLNYVAEGGTLLVQYNTLDDLTTQQLAPYPLTLSRDRITNENAPVRLLSSNHALLQRPNRITTDDFKGWKQEIGLYFPTTWAAPFIPLFSSNDPGEKPKDGLVLAAKYGKGTYIYTGLSFFRQLPEGIPGACRIMANLLSAEQ